MGIESIIVWLIVGAIAGWLAGLIVKGGGFGLILTGFLLILPSWWALTWSQLAINVGYGLIAIGWVIFIYVIWRRTAWRRANPFDPKA